MARKADEQLADNVDLVAHITVNVVPNVSLPDVRAVLAAVDDYLHVRRVVADLGGFDHGADQGGETRRVQRIARTRRLLRG